MQELQEGLENEGKERADEIKKLQTSVDSVLEKSVEFERLSKEPEIYGDRCP